MVLSSTCRVAPGNRKVLVSVSDHDESEKPTAACSAATPLTRRANGAKPAREHSHRSLAEAFAARAGAVRAPASQPPHAARRTRRTAAQGLARSHAAPAPPHQAQTHRAWCKRRQASDSGDFSILIPNTVSTSGVPGRRSAREAHQSGQCGGIPCEPRLFFHKTRSCIGEAGEPEPGSGMAGDGSQGADASVVHQPAIALSRSRFVSDFRGPAVRGCGSSSRLPPCGRCAAAEGASTHRPRVAAGWLWWRRGQRAGNARIAEGQTRGPPARPEPRRHHRASLRPAGRGHALTQSADCLRRGPCDARANGDDAPDATWQTHPAGRGRHLPR